MGLKNNAQSKLVILLSALFVQTMMQSVSNAEPVAEQASSVNFQTQPGFYRYKLGDYEITALSDGSVPQDLHALLQGSSRSDIEDLLKKAHLQNPVEASINSYLINTGEKLILVDTGAGAFFGAGYGGKLIQRLKNSGYEPSQISDILITHVHTDHTGGLVNDGQAVFPNATVYIGQADLDFFLDPNNQNGVNGYDKSYFEQATTALTPYIKLGHISPISGSKLLFPGVNATPTPGHTPGHYFYKVESQGKSIIFIGDSIHVESVQLPKPEITITYDVEQSAAAKQRAVQFERIAREGSLVAAPHLPYPGIGYINQDTTGDGYKFIRAEYHDRDGM